MRKFSDMFSFGRRDAVTPQTDRIKDAMQTNGLQGLGERGESLSSLEAVRKTFTALTFEAKNSGIPRKGESSHPEGARVQALLDEAEKYLEEVRLGRSPQENGSLAGQKIQEVQNILRPQTETSIIPPYDAVEYQRLYGANNDDEDITLQDNVIPFPEKRPTAEEEYNQKVGAWKNMIRLTEDVSQMSDEQITALAIARLEEDQKSDEQAVG